jgi:hypothetical protein
VGCLTTGLLTAIPWQEGAPPLGILCALAGAALPWFDTRWMATLEEPVHEEPDFRPALKDSIRWAILAFLVAILAGFDTCMDWRNMDGIHEGVHLSYVQSWLVGDKPGITVWPEYAPLYVYTIIGWMRAFGMTIFAERGYFQAVQIMGTALHIIALRWACRTWVGSFMGFWTMLTMTLATYVLYGGTNSMRTAVAFAGMVACWRGLESRSWRVLAGSGALFGVALLYSQEYAYTCLLPCLVLFAAALIRDALAAPGGFAPVPALRGRWREGAAWAAGIAAAMAVILLAVFGHDVVDGAARYFGGGYASSRLSGHGARPFPVFPRISNFVELARWKWNLFENVALWWPAFIAGAAGAWLIGSGRAALGGRRLLALAFIMSGLVMQVPAIVRPMGHLTTAGTMIPILGLATLAVDWMWGRPGPSRWWGGIAAVSLTLFGIIRLYTFKQEFQVKYACMWTGTDTHKRELDRLGLVRVVKQQEDGLAFVVNKMRQLCPRDKRIYLSAPGYNHLLFLADRAGMPPYPTTSLAATAAQRAAILQSFDEYKPPLAMITDGGIDLPYKEEHKEEWEYIQKHYRLIATAEAVHFYVRAR